jgi:hypothetical protein
MKKTLHILTIIAVGAVIMTAMGCASAPDQRRFRDRGDYDQFSPVALVSVELTKEVRWEGESDPKQSGGYGLAGLVKGAIKSAVTNAIDVDIDSAGLAQEGERIFLEGLAKLNIPVVAKDTVINSAAYKAVKADKNRADTYIEAAGYKNIAVDDHAHLNKKFAPALSKELAAGGFLRVVFNVAKDVDVGVKGTLATGNMFPRVTMFVYLLDANGKVVAYPMIAGGDFYPFELKYKGVLEQAVDTAANKLRDALELDPEVEGKYVMTESLPVAAGQFDVNEFNRLTIEAMQLLVDKFVQVSSMGQQQYAGTYRNAKK